MVNIDITKDKVVIHFEPMLVRITRLESGLVTEDLKSERPIRNLVDTRLDDILSEIKDLKRIDPKRYEDAMAYITMARSLNNIAKTIEESVNIEMMDLLHVLTSAELP